VTAEFGIGSSDATTTGEKAMKAFRIRSALLASWAFGAALAAVVPVQAQTHTMKMASATINDVQHEWLRRFEAEIKPKVGERLKIEIYPASQLGAIPRMVEGVVLGSIESFVTPPSFLVGVELPPLENLKRWDAAVSSREAFKRATAA